jgi:protein translocase SecG subunit
MSTFFSILPYIQIVLSIVLVVSILLQPSSAGAGGAFGGSDDVSAFHTKRGFEKALFSFSIVIGILFILTAGIAVFL